jgi:hypothetical protein
VFSPIGPKKAQEIIGPTWTYDSLCSSRGAGRGVALGVTIDDMLRTDDNGKPAGPPLALGVEVVVDGNVGLFPEYNEPIWENLCANRVMTRSARFSRSFAVIHFRQRDTGA